MSSSTLHRFNELPRIPAAVQTPAVQPVAADTALCAFCGEPGLHHHPLNKYRVTFDDAVIVVRVPLGLIEREIANWAWDELGRSLPMPRFIAVEYLGGAWSDDLARGMSEIELDGRQAERKGPKTIATRRAA